MAIQIFERQNPYPQIMSELYRVASARNTAKDEMRLRGEEMAMREREAKAVRDMTTAEAALDRQFTKDVTTMGYEEASKVRADRQLALDNAAKANFELQKLHEDAVTGRHEAQYGRYETVPEQTAYVTPEWRAPMAYPPRTQEVTTPAYEKFVPGAIGTMRQAELESAERQTAMTTGTQRSIAQINADTALALSENDKDLAIKLQEGDYNLATTLARIQDARAAAEQDLRERLSGKEFELRKDALDKNVALMIKQVKSGEKLGMAQIRRDLKLGDRQYDYLEFVEDNRNRMQQEVFGFANEASRAASIPVNRLIDVNPDIVDYARSRGITIPNAATVDEASKYAKQLEGLSPTLWEQIWSNPFGSTKNYGKIHGAELRGDANVARQAAADAQRIDNVNTNIALLDQLLQYTR